VTESKRPEELLLDAAQRVAAVLEKNGVACALIGAGAMAWHGQVRATFDLDLAVSIQTYGILPNSLSSAARALAEAGFSARLNDPDPSDPLGGLIRIEIDEDYEIDVVNFLNPWTGGTGALAAEAIEKASAHPGTSLRVVTIPHLIALKVAAGRKKDERDVSDLAAAHADALPDVRAICVRHGLADRLDALLR
jgi:hypothetical protein